MKWLERIQSADGVNWQPLAVAMPEGVTAFKALATAGSRDLVAMTDEGFFSLNTTSGSWGKDAIDDDISRLPDTDICGTCVATAGDKSFECLVVIGKRAGKSVIWQRTLDLTGRQDYAWNYMSITDRYGCRKHVGRTESIQDNKETSIQ